MDRLASDYKRAFPKMMNRPWMLHQCVNPCFDNLKDNKPRSEELL